MPAGLSGPVPPTRKPDDVASDLIIERSPTRKRTCASWLVKDIRHQLRTMNFRRAPAPGGDDAILSPSDPA